MGNTEGDKGRYVPLVFAGACLLLFFVGPLLLWLNSEAIENWANQRDFDSVVWRAQSDSDSSDWPPRLCMVENLIEGGRLEGMSSEEVLDLLGDPSFGENGKFLAFYLGPERGYIRLDSEYLWVNLDSEGNVDGCWTIST